MNNASTPQTASDSSIATESTAIGSTSGGSDAKSSSEGAQPNAAPREGSEPGLQGQVLLRIFGRTDVGQVREHNEDNFIVADLTKQSRGLLETDRNQRLGERGALLGVCDGMGGAAAGEVASQLAVDIVYQHMVDADRPTNRDELAARLVHSIEVAGVRIFSEAKLDRSRRGMGTTATVGALVDDHLFLGQVGDSRAYILRGERLVQVTRDQSLVNQLIEAGQLTEEEAETFEHNNIILQALGTADTVQVDLTYVLLRRGDLLLLCSDGLSGMVRNDEIREILRSAADPLEACKALTDRANQAGGHDNVTVVVAVFEGEGLLPPTPEDVADLKYQKYQLPEPAQNSSQTIPEPAKRLKESGQPKISSRPARASGGPPEIELRVTEVGDLADGTGTDFSGADADDPIRIPTEAAPRWLLVMVIACAVACVTIAGYYLLRW